MKPFLSSKSLLCGLLFAFAAAVAVAEDAAWKSPGFLVDSFVELAMKNSYSTRHNPVRKWITPVRYFIVHRVGDKDLHRELIDAHFRHLAQITGLGIQPAETRAAANFLVVLTSESALAADLPRYFGATSARQNEMLFHHSLCMASFATERRGTIVRAVAMIPVDAARAKADLASCVVEELTHAMGLGNDTLRLLPSIFSRKSNLAFLSGLDHLVLKMLYDPRIKPGMNEKTALPVLKMIAAEYERDGLFAAADSDAAENGLARLMP
jgi:Protein of unknown function (DUF2927)